MQTAGFLPTQPFQQEIRSSLQKMIHNSEKPYLVGYVHDQGAALVGGVSGHAGLFGSANDLAIFYQMLLNKGSLWWSAIF